MVGGRIEIVTPEELLAFEARWPRHTPTKDERIRHELGIGPARFYQLLHRAVLDRDAVAAHPITARRVRERVEAAQEQRSRRVVPRAAASLS